MDRSSILRASTNSYKQVEKCLYLLFLLLKDTAENRTLCRARALRKRVSVFSPRARTPAGGRSRCVFAKRTRGFSAQTVNKIWMRCRSGVYSGSQSINGGPNREESNSMQGASVKQTRSVCSERARTPAGGRSRCGFAKRTRGFSAQCLNPI